MTVLKKIIFTILLFIPISTFAQFYMTGDNPGKTKWFTFDTDNFSIIYPEGTDSLAKAYGHSLEKYRVPVSRSSGYLPGGPDKKRMPVVLHAFNSSNGSVAWAPKRMDLYTMPTPYDTEPLPWMENLAVHESRHVSQMQVGLNNAHKPFYWFLGEMWNGLAAQLYLGISNLEGDAVIAETALTNSGRGRTADFLNYYRVAFDNGDFRTWNKWRFMSQHNYAPDHYALGYLTLGGMRYLYGIPDIVNVASDAASRNPLKLCTVIPTTKKMTSKKFKEAFAEVCDTLGRIWKAEADARAPFISMEPVTKEPRLYTDYDKLVFVKDTLYAVKSGHLDAPVLVRIYKSGEEKTISRFSSQTSALKASPKTGRLYWSENFSDSRWSMKKKSKVKYSTLRDSNKKYLSMKQDDLLFNPDVNPESNMVAAVAYSPEGNSELHIVSGTDGKKVFSTAIPSGYQPVETAWIGQDVYVTMINGDGFGIWKCCDGEWTEVLNPEPVKIKDFKSYGDELMFTCDRTGVNELYHFDPASGELTQKTVTRYGAEDFTYSPDGEWLYFSSQTMKGKKVFRTPADSLVSRKADFSEKHVWILAETLARQERELAAAQGYEAAVSDVEPAFSEVKRYRKFPHAFNLHSWAPFYVSVDNIRNMSYDYTWEAVSLGATGILQNRLSTFTGEFGYSAHKDPYEDGRWRNSGHLKFTYSGWYPVIEADIDFNDRSAIQSFIYGLTTKNIMGETTGSGIYMAQQLNGKPYLNGKLSLYIPFNFSQGGWNSGFIPKISYNVSNDMFDNEIIDYLNRWRYDEATSTYVQETVENSRKPGKNLFNQTITTSLRGYAVTGTSNSAVYPRWGIGGEIGYMRGFHKQKLYSPMQYLYAYGYLPGFARSHGIKLTFTVQDKCHNSTQFSDPVVNILPRGFNTNGTILRNMTMLYGVISKATIDYAMPIYTGDWSIGGTLFSVKRFVLTPHFDFTFIGKRALQLYTAPLGNLFSAGANLAIDFNSLLWLEYPCSFGVTCSYNGGSLFGTYTPNTTVGRFHIAPTFSITF